MDSGVHHPGICYTDFILISLPSIFFDPRSTRIPPIGFLLVEFQGADHAEGAPTGFTVASGGVLSEGCGHGGPGVCLGDGQTKAGGVPSQGGRGDVLLRRMPLYLT